MSLESVTEVDKKKMAAAIQNSTIQYPGKDTVGVDQPLTVEGTYDGGLCPAPQVRITYYDARNNVIVMEGPKPANLLDGTFWDYQTNPPAGTVGVKIETLCGGVVQDMVDGVTFTDDDATTRPKWPHIHAAAGSSSTLEFTIEYPDATGFDQSEVLVIHRVISHTKYAWYGHMFTPNPTTWPRKYTIRGATPGAYVIKYLLVKGTEDVKQHMKFIRLP